jgi:hypothetical protein
MPAADDVPWPRVLASARARMWPCRGGSVTTRHILFHVHAAFLSCTTPWPSTPPPAWAGFNASCSSGDQEKPPLCPPRMPSVTNRLWSWAGWPTPLWVPHEHRWPPRPILRHQQPSCSVTDAGSPLCHHHRGPPRGQPAPATVWCRLHIHELWCDAPVLSDPTTSATHLPSGMPTLSPRCPILPPWTA